MDVFVPNSFPGCASALAVQAVCIETAPTLVVAAPAAAPLQVRHETRWLRATVATNR